jgi:tRNA-Thr(GGU) m(6)t(6)A37 methyltransferase TsaA
VTPYGAGLIDGARGQLISSWLIEKLAPSASARTAWRKPMGEAALQLQPIGYVASPLRTRAEVPRQGDEGTPDARIVILDPFVAGLGDLRPGMDLVVLTSLHQAARDTLRTRPRNDPAAREQGVSSMRSPDRPNPLGLHRVRLLTIDGPELEARGLEAIGATRMVDLKPTLDAHLER